MGFEVNNVQQVLRSFFRLVSSLWYMFHLSFLGAVVEAAEFEDKFFLGGGECNTKKNIRKRLRSSPKFDFFNRCSDGRLETANTKISSKRNCFDTHMLNLEVRWIKDGPFILVHWVD
jgi:hypothetical protein